MTQTEIGTRPTVLGLKVGDLVEVRSAEEILATLDERGELGEPAVHAGDARVLRAAAHRAQGRAQAVRHD